jgi:hypothetical protein
MCHPEEREYMIMGKMFPEESFVRYFLMDEKKEEVSDHFVRKR